MSSCLFTVSLKIKSAQCYNLYEYSDVLNGYSVIMCSIKEIYQNIRNNPAQQCVCDVITCSQCQWSYVVDPCL